MTYFAPRTCQAINETGSQNRSELSSRPIEEFREEAAYVLLGAPGAGKTTVFEQEAKQAGGCYVSARDFITFSDRPEWRDTTLFIDGLDERRVGATDGNTPLDSIRNKLNELGCPRFRLSCRVADWFGTNDRGSLEKVSGNGNVKVLLLDPLSDDDILRILDARSDVTNVNHFILSARNKGIEDLLPNPQTLKMLADATVNGEWPDSRTEIFDMACRRILLEEHNEEHRIVDYAGSGYTDSSTMLDAASRLCAIQLLTGNIGWNTSPGNMNERGYISCSQVTGSNRLPYTRVLESKLFEGIAENRVAPVHRHIAEFLAARYLADLINDGLPVGRVFSLISGHASTIVSELRGLSAWLAVHSKSCRMELIKRDPLGTVLYGDVRNFTIGEKCRLLEHLEQEANNNPWFIRALQSTHRIGEVATPDMEDVFLEYLDGTNRDDARQTFVSLLLLSLRHGQLLSGTTDILIKIVRDGKWKQYIRSDALRTLFRHWRNDETVALKLEKLLADIYGGLLPDPDDELLGLLLIELYPYRLPPVEILRYLRKPKNSSFIGQYLLFWRSILPKTSTNDQIAQILDAFVEQSDRLHDEFQAHKRPNFFLRGVPIFLLQRFLETCQDEIDTNRLFNWLGATSWNDTLDYGVSGSEGTYVRNWIERRPELYKSLFAIGVDHCNKSQESADLSSLRYCTYKLNRRFFNAEAPADFGIWCLNQANKAVDLRVAHYYIRQVARFIHYGISDEGLSPDTVEKRIAGNSSLINTFKARLDELGQAQAKERKFDDSQATEKGLRQRDWRENLKPHQSDLLKNQCALEILSELAHVYYGAYVDVNGDNPKERLLDLLGNDEALIQAVMYGLRNSISRQDLPTESEIIALGVQNRTHLLAYPFMAGLEEIALATQGHEISLNEQQLRLALAIHYTVPIWSYSGNQIEETEPTWFPSVLKSHPEIISDVMIRCIASQLRNGDFGISTLYELASSQNHADVARLAVLPLLEKFPVRCTEKQLTDLNYLFTAAFLYCEEAALVNLVERKLSKQSMTVVQQVYWLCAGVFVSPRMFDERLETYVNGNQRRIAYLAKALVISNGPVDKLSANTLQLLIRLIGPLYRPFFSGTDDSTSEEGRFLSPGFDAGKQIQAFINQLASIPSKDASESLEHLSSIEELVPWQSYFNDARYRQNITRREAEFQYCDTEQVLQVLDNKEPANAADLAALTLDHLRDISSDIRNGNTSDWRQYWNVDSYGRPEKPRPENTCRNTLLSNLRVRLNPLDIDAQPEGPYADDKRSDMRIYYAGFNVPVEVKRSCHSALWTAVKTQLITKYTRDPGAKGYGIYLVFWFGDTEDCRPTPIDGYRPQHADELEELLFETLSEEEKLRISICVVDVSKSP
ncbi:MAG: hypothetical protein OXN26_07010 [Gammaproteobacteria bacterium]|nr:hypothetical protein [Gammaproteobacteria bacterium]